MYYSHRALAKMIYASNSADEVMRDMIMKFGKTRGKVIEEKTVETMLLTFVVLTCWFWCQNSGI